jgi:8-oxo-dGTP pyrophosphatase MutT (NUDIX family)
VPEAKERALRPRDAATLVLVHSGDGPARVLMGQRNSGHVFMPNKFVFPGGRVDAADARVLPIADYHPKVRDRLLHRTTESRARALGMAAIRETFEEAGILVGKRSAPMRATRSPAWQAFHAQGIAPSLEGLELIARAITPAGEPRRFDARFFMADAGQIAGQVHRKIQGDGELLDLHWVAIDDARKLDLPAITRVVIDEIERRLATPRGEHDAIPVPFYRWSGRRPAIEYL